VLLCEFETPPESCDLFLNSFQAGNSAAHDVAAVLPRVPGMFGVSPEAATEAVSAATAALTAYFLYAEEDTKYSNLRSIPIKHARLS